MITYVHHSRNYPLERCVHCGVQAEAAIFVSKDVGPHHKYVYYLPCRHAPHVRHEVRLTEEEVAVVLLMLERT
jgi:hypothetical protein